MTTAKTRGMKLDPAAAWRLLMILAAGLLAGSAHGASPAPHGAKPPAREAGGERLDAGQALRRMNASTGSAGVRVDDEKHAKTATAPTVKHRTLRKGLTLRGRVIDDGSAGVPGTVSVVCGSTERSQPTGPDGEIRIERLVPGDCKVAFAPQGSRRLPRDVRWIRLSAHSAPLVIRRSAHRGRVRVRVNDARASAEVALYPGEPPSTLDLVWTCLIDEYDPMGGAEAAGCEWPGEGAILCERQSAPSDTFQCEDVPWGRYTVVVNDMGEPHPVRSDSRWSGSVLRGPGRRKVVDVASGAVEVKVGGKAW